MTLFTFEGEGGASAQLVSSNVELIKCRLEDVLPLDTDSKAAMMSLSTHFFEFFGEIGPLGLKVQQVRHVFDHIGDGYAEVVLILALKEHIDGFLVAQAEF